MVNLVVISSPLRKVSASARWGGFVAHSQPRSTFEKGMLSISTAVRRNVAKLPAQAVRIPEPLPQQALTKLLLDVSSVQADAVIEDAQARRSHLKPSFLNRLNDLYNKHRTASKKLITAGEEAKKAHRAVEALMRQQSLQKQAQEGKTSHCSSPATSSSGEEERRRRESRERRRRVKTLQEEQDALADEVQSLMATLPNRSHPSSPRGPEARSRVVLVHWGTETSSTLSPDEQMASRAVATVKKDFSLQDWQDVVQANRPSQPTIASPNHLELSARLSHNPSLDMAAGRFATGPSFAYLLGPLALLEQALLRYATSMAYREGFVLVSAPNVVRTQIAERCGFNPRDGEAGQTYFVHSSSHNASDSSELCLVGTAEISLAGLLAGRTFDEDQLPAKVFAISPSFRAEAGGRGTDTKGLYRLHQFNKAEMFVVSSSAEGRSNAILEDLCDIQQRFLAGLGLTFRVLDMATEELGASAHRKYDIEAWMPGRQSWGEVSSASNCTDYQSSRLHILQRAKKGRPKACAAHTLNATLCAVPRIIIALMEQYGVDQSGRLRLPDTLRPHWIGAQALLDGGVEWIATQSKGDDASASWSSSKRATRLWEKISWHQSGVMGMSALLPQLSSSLFQRLRGRLKAVSARTGTDLASLTASFFLLHEITAILPLIALFYLLGLFGLGERLCNWFVEAAERPEEAATLIPQDQWRRKVGDWLKEGMQSAERYAKTKGLWEFTKECSSDGSGQADAGDAGQVHLPGQHLGAAFFDIVAAYVVTKALLVPRLILSFWLSPAFARSIIEPGKRVIQRFGRRVSPK